MEAEERKKKVNSKRVIMGQYFHWNSFIQVMLKYLMNKKYFLVNTVIMPRYK